MKHRKYLLKTCVLLALFVCASAAPAVYAQDTPAVEIFGGLSTISVGDTKVSWESGGQSGSQTEKDSGRGLTGWGCN